MNGQWGTYGRQAGWGQGTQVVEQAVMQQQATGTNYMELLQGAAPIVSSIAEAVSDPYKRVGILEAQLNSAKSRGASLQEIGRIEAKLMAAQRRLQIKIEGESATRQWRTLGQLGVVTGIGVGAAVILYVLSRAVR